MIEAGTTFAITGGAYDDYLILALAEALVDLDPGQVQRAYLIAHPESADELNEDEVLAWMAEEELIEIHPTVEFHMGKYGCINFNQPEGIE